MSFPSCVWRICPYIVADVLFSQKLAEELKYEKESAAEGEPEFLKTFKAQGLWTVSASPPFFSVRVLMRADRGRRGQRRGHDHTQLWQ